VNIAGYYWEALLVGFFVIFGGFIVAASIIRFRRRRRYHNALRGKRDLRRGDYLP